jgi:hypothetical protein
MNVIIYYITLLYNTEAYNLALTSKYVKTDMQLKQIVLLGRLFTFLILQVLA